MITITITGDTVLVRDNDRAYIEKHFNSFDKFADDGYPHEISVTVSKTSAHSRQNSVLVEARFHLHGTDFFARSESHDVRSAADLAKEELMREVTRSHAKKRTLFHRGARRLKKMMKGDK